jgi:hypothetical protein
MARARCDFYTSKGSSKRQLLEAKENLQKMLAGIPLTDDERAAVDDGQAALDQLLDRLTDVPTPAGPTPRQIGAFPPPRHCYRSSMSDRARREVLDKSDSTERVGVRGQLSPRTPRAHHVEDRVARAPWVFYGRQPGVDRPQQRLDHLPRSSVVSKGYHARRFAPPL